jgi:hypothetical protein
MTASKRAKELGCKSLVQVSEHTDQSVQTLQNWWKNKRKLFESVCRDTAIFENGKAVFDENGN